MKIFYPFDRVVWGFLKLNCMNCLHVLDINPLSVISFANILFYSVGCLFIFVGGFHCCAKAYEFNGPICLSLLLLFCFRTELRKYWYDLYQRMFRLCSLLGVTGCHIFQPLSHAEFLFVYGVKECANCTDFHASA